MALMDKNGRKRQRFESEEYCSNPLICVEGEENPGKRICEKSNCGNVDMISEIMSHDVHSAQESIDEDLVSDIIKRLEEEMASSSLHEKTNVNKCSSHQVCNILGNDGDEAESVFREELEEYECEFNAFHGDLWWGSEMENLEYYLEDYGFFECLEMERDVEHQLLLQKWWGDNDSGGCDTRDLISFQDCSLF